MLSRRFQKSLKGLWLKFSSLFSRTKVEDVTPKPPRKEIERRRTIAERRGYTGDVYRRYVDDGVTPLNLGGDD